MKGYEGASKVSLPGRMPVVVRVDGKAFHTYTRGCARPWDNKLTEVMDTTATQLCQDIQGVQVAYVQSDEISLLLHNYKKLESQAWFDNEVQKMVSVSAAIASATFTLNSYRIWSPGDITGWPDEMCRPAYFDSRAFVLPEAEVCNYFIWRQQDATRNSVQMLARSLYSHKELHGKNNADLQDLCHKKGHNWNDLPTNHKRGRCVIRNAEGKWVMDNNIPIFTADRDYLNKLLSTDPA